MERDFLGIGGQQNSGALMKKENRMDSAISIGSRPFSNKATAVEQFMSFQPIASVDASRKASILQAPENQGNRSSTRQLNDARFAMTNPFLKSHNSSNGPNPSATAVKQQQPVALSPRKKAQLTIFYAGSVKVYDDVSCDMAKAIMLMASRECEPAPITVHQSSGLSSTVSIGCGPAAAAKSNLTSKNESSKTIMPKAVPQARKASLARFLEKRKERVSNMMPYNSCEKKHSDNSNGKCLSDDVSIQRNQGGSWQTKSCSGNCYYPGIILEM